MKIIRTNLPESYWKLLEKSFICVGLDIPEHIRLKVRENMKRELLLTKELEAKNFKKNIDHLM